MPKLDSDKHQEILVLFQSTIDDIDRTKQWLWTLTTQAIIAQAGLLALFFTYGSRIKWMFYVFAILTIAIGISGCVFAKHAKSTLQHFRNRLAKCREFFSEEFNQAFTTSYPKLDLPSTWVLSVATLIVLTLLSASHFVTKQHQERVEEPKQGQKA